MRELRKSAETFHQNELDLGETMISNEDSEKEDYHMVTGANRQLRKQISHNPNFFTTRQDPTLASPKNNGEA